MFNVHGQNNWIDFDLAPLVGLTGDTLETQKDNLWQSLTFNGLNVLPKEDIHLFSYNHSFKYGSTQHGLDNCEMKVKYSQAFKEIEEGYKKEITLQE